MKKLLAISALFLFSAHELFLRSDSYFLEPDTTYEMFLYNGTFVKSENGITSDRIINPVIVGPNLRAQPPVSAFQIENKVTRFPFSSGEEGSYVVGISTLPRVIELSAGEFHEYLEHEGLQGVIEDRKKSGLDQQPARERYAKHVKALLQVGNSATPVSDPVGYPVEIIPLDNPYKLPPSGLLRFRLLREGKALGNQTVHSGYLHEGNLAPERSYTTNKRGEFTVRIDHPGQWYLASIYMERVKEEEVDYESNWTTLSFEVRNRDIGM